MMHPRLMVLIIPWIVITSHFGDAIADNPHRLAYSAKLGVEVLAEGGGGWCRDKLQLQVIAKDIGLFQSAEIQTLIRKLGVVIKGECATAKSADVRGYAVDSNTPLYQASATGEANWTLTAAEITSSPTISPQRQADMVASFQQEKKKNNELEKAWLNAFGDYQLLQNASRLQRLGYLFSKTFLSDTESFTLGDAPYLAATSLATQKEIKATLLLHISEMNGGNVQSDWPSPVFLKLDERNQAIINQEGWYIVDGNITGSLDDNDTSNLLASVMHVWNAVRCEQDYCNEVDNALSLVQKVNGLPDWNPNFFEDYDACSGETCRKEGVFIAKINTSAHQEHNDKSPIAFDIKKGEKLLALTSVVVTEPTPIKVIAFSKIGNTTAQPGDVLHEVTNEGEGFCKVIYKGKLVDGVTTYDEKSFKHLKDINRDNSTEWGKVINFKGQQGWVKNDFNIFWGTSNYDDPNERAAFDRSLEEESHE